MTTKELLPGSALQFPGYKKGAIIGLLLMLGLFYPFNAYAHPEDDGNGTEIHTIKIQEPAPQLFKKNLSYTVKQGTYFLLGIKERLARSEAENKLLTSNIYTLEGLVADNKNKIRFLSQQITNIDQQLHANEQKALAIRLYIAELSNSIIKLKEDLVIKKQMMNRTIAEVNRLLRNMYVQASVLYSYNTPEEQLLALVAHNASLHDISQKKQYSLYINEATRVLIGELDIEEKGVHILKEELEHKERIIGELQTALSLEALRLSEIRDAKNRLLRETQGKQELYEDLLATSQKESVHVGLDIARLQENYSFFEEKLAAYKIAAKTQQFNNEESSLNLSGVSIKELEEELKYLRGTTPLAWPVSPSLGISAFFHDAEYKSALGIGHNAIDIRALQGSKARSAADGVVSKVADNGFGYSYVIITHPEKIITLYGHLSEIQVKEGQIIRQGEVIGLSGGMPGTKGAGWLTTGPHLHFEVFKDFKHTDPLIFLPLEFLPKETLKSKYIERIVR